MKPILVTGGAGYIGSHFVHRYVKKHPQTPVIVVDNLSEGHPQSLENLAGVTLIQENIGNIEAMSAIFSAHAVQTVIHFAASCYVGVSQEQPAAYFENNVIQSLSLLNAMDCCGVKEIVFSSTCASYGNPEYFPIDEKHPQKPINVYGSTKLMVEQALRAYSLARGLSSVSLRYFNASGADEQGLIGEHHDPETHLIPLILQVALGQRNAIHIYGNDYDTPDGTAVRDYIHVNDLADAHIAAIDYLRNHPGAEAFNLGTRTGSSVLEVIDMCRKVTNREIPVQLSPRRLGDPAILVSNAEKAETLLDWRAQYELQAIIETAWRWEQSRRY
jgi:UDP-glucose 4-epimerase